MEKVFSILACTNHQKVAFATYMFEADAKFWWNSVKRLLEESQTNTSQEVFKDAFYQKYFPTLVWNAKELEFMQLCQGGRSVSEYIAKFKELCKFSTIYQQNPDEAWKCIKFEGGLREDILATVEHLEIRDFPTLLNKYRLIEECNRKLAAAKSASSNFRKGLALQGPKFKPNLQQQRKFQPIGNKGKQPQKPLVKQTCAQCGKNHDDRPCLVGQNIYYECGKLGHKIYECPTRNPQSAPKPQCQGRVFTMNTEEIA